MRLPQGLLQRKFRAVECHLANVIPSDNNNRSSKDKPHSCVPIRSEKAQGWSREARDFFIERVRNKRLVIQVKSLMIEGQPIVDLWDTTPGLAALASSHSESAASSPP